MFHTILGTADIIRSNAMSRFGTAYLMPGLCLKKYLMKPVCEWMIRLTGSFLTAWPPR